MDQQQRRSPVFDWFLKAVGALALGQHLQSLSRVPRILNSEEVKPHKVRYYLVKRDPEFAEKMAEVLCVYRKGKLLKRAAARSKRKPNGRVAIVSYDEKPGIQAIATTSPDLPAEPGVHATFARDHEYKRHGMVTLLAGIDLVTGKVHAMVEDRHRSREFVAFLKRLDKAYSADTAIHLILDNHFAHISRRPKPGSPSNPRAASSSPSLPSMAPGSTSSRASSPSWPAPCCAISVSRPNKSSGNASWPPSTSFNRDPVVHTWTYKLDKAA